jgi:hypothetical protein
MNEDAHYVDANFNILEIFKQCFIEGSILFTNSLDACPPIPKDTRFVAVSVDKEISTEDLKSVHLKGEIIFNLVVIFNQENNDYRAIVPAHGQSYWFNQIKNGTKSLYRKKTIIPELILYYISEE